MLNSIDDKLSIPGKNKHVQMTSAFSQPYFECLVCSNTSVNRHVIIIMVVAAYRIMFNGYFIVKQGLPWKKTHPT